MDDQNVDACGPFTLACPTDPPRLAGASFALRTARDRFISPSAGSQPEFYDLSVDRNERTNLLSGGVLPHLAGLVDKLSAELDAKLVYTT